MFLALPALASGRGDAQERHMASDETQEDPKLPPDARLDSLEERLKRAQELEAKRNHKAQPDPSSRAGQLVLSHLIGAPLGGGLIGWGLDSLFGTRPWLLLAMLVLGFGVGVRNVIRISNSSSGRRPGA
jgi:ATP synthase protein I